MFLKFYDLSFWNLVRIPDLEDLIIYFLDSLNGNVQIKFGILQGKKNPNSKPEATRNKHKPIFLLQISQMCLLLSGKMASFRYPLFFERQV